MSVLIGKIFKFSEKEFDKGIRGVNMSTCFSSAELFATCGGSFAGSCVNSTCECEEGWTASADFITMDLTR